MGEGMPIKHTWSESDRFVPRSVVQPVQRLLDHEAAGGIVMLLAATVAIAWANSPWSQSYTDLWSTPLQVELGALIHLDHLSLQAWVNDALMAIFFLLVGAEIKREVVHGDLGDLRAVALPIIAALGGMIVPAVIYAAITRGEPGAEGWGIPMATDIAFAVGVVSLLGTRVPLGAKVFLLTLAVADDIGAIVVIAVFYTADLDLRWLALAVGLLLVMVGMRLLRIWVVPAYVVVGAVAWLATLESGVHATLVGVAIGLMTPATPLLKESVAREYAQEALADRELDADEAHRLRFLLSESVSMVERLQTRLHPVSAYVVLPVFALANAGVALGGGVLGDAVDSAVALGIALGLVVGKPIGIVLAAFLAVRLGLGRLPQDTGWRMLTGLGAVGGIGFTVSLFSAGLSFPGDPLLTGEAKVGILAGSLLAAVLGVALLLAGSRRHDAE